MKIFLSHSSNDKAIVKKVYDELGAALCHYDAATFSPTGNVSEEIYKALSESTHFVFFASEASLNSQWVKGELERAFDGWMRGTPKRAMVFLLGTVEVHHLPPWMQRYIMREPPSYRHIICRIQSEIDKDNRGSHKVPPFYRQNELKQLETKLLVETSNMPGALLIHGPEGSGRKELINQVYERQFPAIASRKLLIRAPAFVTDKELYRDLVGLITLATPAEFAEIFAKYDSLDSAARVELLCSKILECTTGNQVLIIEGDYSLFTDEGDLPDWLINIIEKLAGNEYPKLAITGYRRPIVFPGQLLDKLIVQEVPALDGDNSKILFNWWLKSLDSPYSAELKNDVYEACTGSPKQLELGAKLLVAQGAGNIAKIRPHLLKTLEGLSRQLLEFLSKDNLCATILAFVANAGFITRSDLTQYLNDANIAPADSINSAISDCSSFGFLIEDDVCLRMPNYLIRGARAIGRDDIISEKLKKLWELQAKSARDVKLDEVTSISTLNEYSLSLLRQGKNIGPIFESIILPSQCLQVARARYEQEDYAETIELCEMAYTSRAALSTDGLIETLRYLGMAAARLGNDEEFSKAISRFSEVQDSPKAQRMTNFVQGFRKRLAGFYDEALSYLQAAHTKRGEFDIHVLRELAFVSLNVGDITNARRHIATALGRASSNHYVLEMAIRVELASAPAAIAQKTEQIEILLERLHSFDSSRDKIYWTIVSCEYHIVMDQTPLAESLLNRFSGIKSAVLDMIRARILMKKKQYPNAVDLLSKLFYMTKGLKVGQRQSTLPIISRALVEASAAVQVVDGIKWFEECRKYLPRQIARQLASEMLDMTNFTKQSIPNGSRALLNSAAGRS